MVDEATTHAKAGPDRRRGRPSAAERQAIDDRVMEVAFAIFRAEGYEAARMDKVASEAGITKMTLYRRFPSKADLLAEVIRRQSAQLHADVAVTDAQAAPVSHLQELLWAYRTRIGADRMLALQRLALTALREDPVRSALAEVRARYVAPVDMLVEAAKRGGSLPDLPTEELREILFDLLVNDAASIPLHGYPSPEDQRRIFLQRWQVVQHGLLRGPPEVTAP